MSFTDRTTSIVIGHGDFLSGLPVLMDEEPNPSSSGWDGLTATYAIRRAELTAADAAELFPTGSQRGTDTWWVVAAKPSRVSPGVWKITVSYSGWAGAKPKFLRGGYSDGNMVPLAVDEWGEATQWGFQYRIFAQYVVASHEEIDATRAALITSFAGPELAAEFPLGGAAIADYQTRYAAWEVANNYWLTAIPGARLVALNTFLGQWANWLPADSSRRELFQNRMTAWIATLRTWQAGRPAEIAAQIAWDAADADFDIRHAEWVANATWNVATAQVVRSAPIYFPNAAGTGESTTAAGACTATIAVAYGVTPTIIYPTFSLTLGMTRQAAAEAIATAINGDGTLGPLYTAAAVLPAGETGGSAGPWCVEITRDTTAANDPNLAISFTGDNGLTGLSQRFWILNQTPSFTVLAGLAAPVAEPVWTGGTRPTVTTAETAPPTPPEVPYIPTTTAQPLLLPAPIAPVYPTAVYTLTDSQTERLPGSPATLVTDTLNQLFR